MKKSLLGCFILGTGALFAQTFTDNFDSYTAGSKLAQQSAGAWTTWSNAPGGTEDPNVSAADAHSAPNSVYFSSSAQTGGPVDLIRKFGGTYTTGQFTMDMWLKVESGKAGYFNIQGVATLGNMYSLECFMNANGTLDLANQVDGTVLSTTYTQNTWFQLTLDIDLNTNTWELLLNNVSKGTFSNSNNSIFAIDIFPVNQASPYAAGYYMDDFSTTYTAYSPVSLNIAPTKMNIEGKVAGMTQFPRIAIRNLGTTPITSCDVEIDYNGTQQTQTLTGLNIASLAEYSFTSTNSIVLTAGSMPLTVTVSNINGGVDNVPADDAKTWNLNPIVPATGKVVVAEEGTGTWCQWCPRGAVFMEKFDRAYHGFFAPIAAHNGDVMTVTAYDAGLGYSGFPSAKVDRGAEKDPSALQSDIESRLLVAPKAYITNGATWNSTTRELKVSLRYDFQGTANNNYKINCVLTQDSVKGTGSGYNQSNAYAGGSNGVMGGFEALPNPVPAATMVYDFVARAIAPSFAGTNSIFPVSIPNGGSYIANFTFTLPATWNENKINIIGFLKDPSGKIDNAGTATLAEAIANGFENGTTVAAVEDMLAPDSQIKMFPNPANEYTNVVVNLKGNSEVALQIMDISGKVVAERNYGELSGTQELGISTANFNSGIYFVAVKIGSQSSLMKLIVE
jgi:hypothetical protein